MSDTLNNKLPAFLVIGAGKSGTTSLHEYLRQHPKISLPTAKETHFFVLDKSAPRSSLFEHGRPATAIDDLNEYFAGFEPKGQDEIRGEVCPSYMVDGNAPANIKKHIPNVKIIAILRDPVDRLYSVTNFLSLDNDINKLEEIVKKALSQKDFNDHPREVMEGFYFQLLSRYYDLFPKENIRVYLFDEFINDPNTVLTDILDFIGLDKDFKFDVNLKFNPSGKPKLPFLAKFIRNDNFYKFVFRNLISDKRFQVLRAKYQSWMYKKAAPLSAELQQAILSLYLPDMLSLEGLLNRDFSHWREIS